MPSTSQQISILSSSIESLSLVESYTLFENLLLHGGLDGHPIDLLLSCVDNYSARITINIACMRHNILWMESGVSEDAVSGHIQLIVPGRTACFQCIPPMAIASGMDEKTIRRDGVCTASLPTTMGIVAGLLAQNVLKVLLHFGQVSYYLGYSAMNNFFPSDVLRPSKDCTNPDCRRLQEEYAGKWSPEVWTPRVEQAEEENEWGITYPLEGYGSFLHDSVESCGEEKIPSTQSTEDGKKTEDEISVEELINELNALCCVCWICTSFPCFL